MNTFCCTQCGYQVQRPTQPYRCPQCGTQAVGLFKLVPSTAPQPTVPGVQQGSPPQHGGISPVGAPPPPPGPVRPATPPAQQPPTQQPPAQPPAAQPPPAKKTPAAPTPRPKQPPKPTAAAGKKRPSTAKPQPPAAKVAKPKQTRPPAKPKPPKPKPAEPKPPKPKPRVRPQAVRPEQFVWAYPPQPPFEDQAQPVKNAPAVDAEGRIYLCTQDRLVALIEEGGKAKVDWEYVVGCHVPGPVVAAPDGTLRIHAGDGYLHCVTAEGKQHWPPALVGEPLGWAAPVVDARDNTYISAYEGGLLRVDAKGKPGRRPYFRSRRKFDSAGVVHEDMLVIGSEDGYMFAVRLDQQCGTNTWDHASERGYAGGFVNSSPAVSQDGGIIVVAARDERLYGFAPTGDLAWCAPVPGQILGSAVIDPAGHVYAGVSQAHRGRHAKGLLVCVDGNSHKIRWEYRAAGAVESTPVVGDDGLIYFGDNSGTIHALDARGEAQWTAKVEAAVRSAGTIISPHRLAFGLDDDTLVVLECSAEGLAARGWPKIARNLGQTGTIELPPAPSSGSGV